MNVNYEKIMLQVPPLHNDAVHVWVIDLTSIITPRESIILNEEERKKVRRLQTSQHQQNALAIRVRLRQLLAQYVNCNPSDIEFVYGKFGKPFVKNSSIFFNLSHSDDTALVAIGLCKELGIDIEYWRTIGNIDGMIKRNFSDSEKKRWLSVTKEQQQELFFNLWSCKESFIKATGRGLGLGVSRCVFSVEKPHKLQECPAEFGQVDEWTTISLDIIDKASVSLMLHRKTCQLNVYTFDPEIPPQAVQSSLK